MSIFYASLKNLSRKPFRTTALIFSIALLVSLLAFALLVNAGISKSVEKTLDRLGGDLMIVPQGYRIAAEEFLFAGKEIPFYMDKSIIEEIRVFEGVDRVTYHTYLKTLPALCCGVSQAPIIAIDAESDFVVYPWLEKNIGRKLQREEVVIGSVAHTEFSLLGVENVALILGMKFTIAGVLERTGTSLDHAIFVREEDVREAMEKGLPATEVTPNQISVVFAAVKPGYDPEWVARAMEEKFPKIDVVPRGKIGGMVKETFARLNKIFTATIFLASALSALLLWAAFSAITNERKREAGIIRAIGANRFHVLRLFLYEAVLIGTAGGILGIVAGNFLYSSFADRFAVFGFFAAFTISTLSFITGVALCILSSLPPILKISGMEPYEAIRAGE